MDEHEFARRVRKWFSIPQPSHFRDAAYSAAKARGEKDFAREFQGLLDQGADGSYRHEAMKGHKVSKGWMDRAVANPGENVAGIPVPPPDKLGNIDGAETPEFQADYERRRREVRERLQRLHQNRKDAGGKDKVRPPIPDGRYKSGRIL